MTDKNNEKPAKSNGWRAALHDVIFGADTPAGKWFDVILIFSILLSVLAVMLDSVKAINLNFGKQLYLIEWFFTLLFTIEYILRIISTGKPIRYIFSFFGIVDFISIIPTYISVILPSSKYVLVLRMFRILRVFRVLKLVQYLGEANLLMKALKASYRKITVFLFAVLILVTIFGAFMYVVEGEENGFTSIPRSIYWSIVTLTTVGYGDISPKTNFGQMLSTVIMILGYGIIAVPTGFVTVEFSHLMGKKEFGKSCIECGKEDHDKDAEHCKYCGAHL